MDGTVLHPALQSIGMLCLFYHLFHILFRRHAPVPSCTVSGKAAGKSREEDDEVIFWP